MISSEKRKLFQKSQSSKFAIFQNFPVFVFYFKKNYFTIKRPQERKQTFYRFNPSKCFVLQNVLDFVLQDTLCCFSSLESCSKLLVLEFWYFQTWYFICCWKRVQTDDFFIILVIHLFETLNTSVARSWTVW